MVSRWTLTNEDGYRIEMSATLTAETNPRHMEPDGRRSNIDYMCWNPPELSFRLVPHALVSDPFHLDLHYFDPSGKEIKFPPCCSYYPR